MKTKIILYIILFGALMASCKDTFLDETNPNAITSDDFWQTEDDLNAAVASVYWAGTCMYGPLGSLTTFSDNARTGEISGNWQDICTFSNNATSWFPSMIWSTNYKGIFFANQIIKYGGDMSLAEDIKNEYIAEAKFFRGLFYFDLANKFGDVPVITTLPNTTVDFYIAKSGKDTVFQQAISDFKAAAELLPVKRDDDSQIGRVTKGTALAYLGRLYLYQENWTEARNVLKSIVDEESTYGYGLLDNFSELFDGNHENSKESLFEVQYSPLEATDIWGNYLCSVMSPTYAPGVVGGDWLGALTIDTSIKDAFLQETTSTGALDSRAEATIAWNYPDCMYYTRKFNLVEDGKSFFDTTEVYVKKYTNWWTVGENVNKNAWESYLNYYGMRYADVLLMLSESYTMLNDVADAALLVQRIRTRAGLANKTSEMSSYSTDQMMDEIRHQRNLEFYNESLSFFDLRRWGLLEAKIGGSPNPFKDKYSSKFEYYPIPSDELDANKNMTQSEAWK